MQQGVRAPKRFHKRESEAESADLTRVSEATSAIERSAERPSEVHENALAPAHPAVVWEYSQPSRA